MYVYIYIYLYMERLCNAKLRGPRSDVSEFRIHWKRSASRVSLGFGGLGFRI